MTDVTETNVTRGEFAMLVQQVTANAARLDAIDTGGTRGIGILQQQITDLAKDVHGVELRLEQHDRQHDEEKRERLSGRRWLMGLAFGLLASIDGPVLAILFSHHS